MQILIENFSAEKLKIVRKKNGYNQRSLADKIGTTVTTISAWENGKTRPTRKNIQKLALELKCKVEDLISNLDEQIEETEKIDFQELIITLSKIKKQKNLRAIKYIVEKLLQTEGMEQEEE